MQEVYEPKRNSMHQNHLNSDDEFMMAVKTLEAEDEVQQDQQSELPNLQDP